MVPTTKSFSPPSLFFTHNLNYLSDSHVTFSRLSLVLRVHFSLLFFDPVSLLMAYQHHGSRSTRSVDAKLRVHRLTIVSIIDIHVAVVVVTSLSAGRQSF